MNISRLYLVIGSLYLLVGVFLGMYMGGAQDFTLAPVHAHINLVGFTLMTIFGIAYRVFFCRPLRATVWPRRISGCTRSAA